ncbi:MAG: AAA family ATPase [Phycisphaeraceae bacterium]|nr:AAA family ATPase [Phycisphaeraceae bacterium]MCW5763485.1 AAA family ATPase [Phycisphaeraceae bacterium]
MQTLSKVSIYNFKSCRNLEDVEFADFTPLVGYNNAGKSNVLAALQWVLKKSVLPESAFFDPASAVRVEARITGLTQKIIDNLGTTHKPKIEPFVKDGVVEIQREQPRPGGSASDIKLKVRDLSKPAGDAAAWKENPSGIDNAISALFPEPISIAAMDDAGKDIGKFETGSTIGKLIAKLMTAMKETQGKEIARRLDELRKLLDAEGDERAIELENFDRKANGIVAEFFPGVEVRVHVPAPELTTMFKAGTIKVYETNGAGPVDPNGRDVSSLGHGAQRAIQMALIRQLAESAEASKGGRTLLLIDEPELYMHPQAVAKVRSALRKLSSGPYQVIFTTHSPLMIGRDEIGAVLVLCKNDANGTTKRKRLAQAIAALEKEAQAQLDELFSVEGAGQVLFSDRVILAEGKTERELVPDLFEALYGAPPADHRIGFVALDGSGNTAKCLKVLGQMGIPTRAVVDLDYAFRGAVSSKVLDVNDEDIAACKALCPAIADAMGVALGDDGFFSKHKRRECFEILAADVTAEKYISSLHTKLKDKDIWLWTKGAIEPHVGLTSKDYKAWHAMRKALQQKKLGAVADSTGVEACLRWLAGE